MLSQKDFVCRSRTFRCRFIYMPSSAGNVVRVTGLGFAGDLTQASSSIMIVSNLFMRFVRKGYLGEVCVVSTLGLVFFLANEIGACPVIANSILAGVSSLSSTRSKGPRFRRIYTFRCWPVQAMFAEAVACKNSVATGYSGGSSLRLNAAMWPGRRTRRKRDELTPSASSPLRIRGLRRLMDCGLVLIAFH